MEETLIRCLCIIINHNWLSWLCESDSMSLSCFVVVKSSFLCLLYIRKIDKSGWSSNLRFQFTLGMVSRHVGILEIWKSCALALNLLHAEEVIFLLFNRSCMAPIRDGALLDSWKLLSKVVVPCFSPPNHHHRRRR